MSLMLANPRELPTIPFSETATAGGRPTKDELSRLLDKVHARALAVVRKHASWATREIEPWQVRSSVWLLDSPSQAAGYRPGLVIPEGLCRNFDPRSDRPWDGTEVFRAIKERALRFDVGTGLVGRVFQEGRPLAAVFPGYPGPVGTHPASPDGSHQAYGLSEAQIAVLHPGLRWILGLPLLARDASSGRYHVLGVFSTDGLEVDPGASPGPETAQIESIGEDLHRDVQDLAAFLSKFPSDRVEVDSENHTPLWPGTYRLGKGWSRSMAHSELVRLRGTTGELFDLALKVVEVVEEFEEDGQAALLSELAGLGADASTSWDSPEAATWGIVLLLASEEVHVAGETACRELRVRLMALADALGRVVDDESWREGFRVHLMALAGASGRVVDEKPWREFAVACGEQALLAAIRATVALAPKPEFSEVASWLGEFLGRDRIPLVQQGASQGIQHLCWQSPPPPGGWPSHANLCDRLGRLAGNSLEPGRGDEPIDKRASRLSLAMNALQGLGMLGAPAFQELALQVARKEPILHKLLIPRLRESHRRWIEADSADSPMIKQFHNTVRQLEKLEQDKQFEQDKRRSGTG